MNKRMGLRGTVSALVLVAIGTTTALAQDATYLDEIILVGTGLPTEVMDSPASVNVVGAEEIKRVPPSSVARILNDIPGVRVSESGIERISIRGESSQRVAIMIDGQRISDHTTYGTPILISPAAIERIEVVRGPSSVVSGNRAIGGVVNIVTKRGADVPFELSSSVGYMSATEGWRASVNMAGSQGDFDYRLTMSQSDLGDRRAVSGTLTPSAIEDRDLSLHLGYEMGNHYFGFRAQDFDLAADVYTGDPAFVIDLPERDLRKYALFYEGTDLTPWMTRLKVDAFSQTVDRLFSNDIATATPFGPVTVLSTSDDEQTTSGFSANAELSFSAGSRSIVGFEYEDDRMIADKVTTSTTPFGPPFPTVTTRYSDATIKTWSLFAQHEIDLSDTLTATFGGRYYDVRSELDLYEVNGAAEPTSSDSDDRFLGSVGLTYSPSADVTYRASISQGYTYPSLPQLYLTTTAGGSGTTNGNPDLRPETSTSYEIGARVDRGAITLDGTLFYTESEDYIDSFLVVDNPGTSSDVYEYRNVDQVKSFGIELGAEFDSGVWGLRPYANLAYIRREYSYQTGFSTFDSGTPSLSGTIGVRRDYALGNVSGELDLFLSGESGSILRGDDGSFDADEDVFHGYATLNLRGSAQLNDNLDLTFEVGNILDREYQSSGQIEGAGRNISVFLNATF
ncbi:TonB-dependent receptor [Aliiroseovarius sp.]|uniref:TonB-dependent receptor n=1 Tax=Aliiroseovarius sp. TaxID=1872442 RepID=UPI003BAD723E